MSSRALVTGAGGFIGHHLADHLKRKGARGRNSDNTRFERVLGWAPEVSLEDGLALTHAWIESQVK